MRGNWRVPSPGWVLIGAGAILLTTGAIYLERLDAPGPQPEGIASDGVHLWVADFQTGLIYRMDTESGTVVASYQSPGSRPEGLAWDGSHLWTADWDTRQIYRLEVTESALIIDRQFPSPNGARPVGLTWDGASLWITTWAPYYLHQLDASDGTVLRSRLVREVPNDTLSVPLYPTSTPRSHQPEDLAWDGTDLWITDWGTREIHRLDPASLTVTRTIPSGASRSVGLTFHKGYLWNGDTTVGQAALYRLEETDNTVPTLPITWGRLKRLDWRRGEP